MRFGFHSREMCCCCCLVAQPCPTLSNPVGCSVHRILQVNTGLGCHVLLQGIFPTQGLNPGLLHCRQILYHLSHQGSPRILEWVAYSFSSGSSWPRNRSGVCCIAGRFCTDWATREELSLTWLRERVRFVSVFAVSLVHCLWFASQFGWILTE